MSGRAAWRLFQAAANVSSWTPWSGAKKRDAENRGAGSVVLISLGHAYATELNNSMTFSDSTILLSVLSSITVALELRASESASCNGFQGSGLVPPAPPRLPDRQVSTLIK